MTASENAVRIAEQTNGEQAWGMTDEDRIAYQQTHDEALQDSMGKLSEKHAKDER